MSDENLLKFIRGARGEKPKTEAEILKKTTEYQKQRIKQAEQVARLRELEGKPLSGLDSLALGKKPSKPKPEKPPKKLTEAELARGSFERVTSPEGGSPHDTATVMQKYPKYWEERTKKPRSIEEKRAETLKKRIELVKLESEDRNLNSEERKAVQVYDKNYKFWEYWNDRANALTGRKNKKAKKDAEANRDFYLEQLDTAIGLVPLVPVETEKKEWDKLDLGL